MKQNKNLKATMLNILAYVGILLPIMISLAGFIMLIEYNTFGLSINPTILAIAIVVGLFILFPLGACVSNKLFDKVYEIKNL